MNLRYLCPSEFYLFLYCYLALVSYYTQLYMFVLLFGFSIVASEYVTDSELPTYVRYVYRYTYLFCCYKIFKIITLGLSLNEYELVFAVTLVLVMLLNRCLLESVLLCYFLIFGLFYIIVIPSDSVLWFEIELISSQIVIYSTTTFLIENWEQKPFSETRRYLSFSFIGFVCLAFINALNPFHIFVITMSIVFLLFIPADDYKPETMKRLGKGSNWLKYLVLNFYFNRHHEGKLLLKSVCSKKLIPWLSKWNRYFLQTSLLSYPNFCLFVKLYQCKCTFIGWDIYYQPLLTRLRMTPYNPFREGAAEMTQITEALNRMERKLALLWVSHKRFMNRLGRLPRALLREVVIYLE